jgi:hypothetical protein
MYSVGHRGLQNGIPAYACCHDHSQPDLLCLSGRTVRWFTSISLGCLETKVAHMLRIKGR